VARDARKWDRRIARARELAETFPFARQILLFFCQVTAFQKSSYLQIPSALQSSRSGLNSLPTVLDEVDLAHLLLRWQPFLSMLESEAPGPLAEFARDLKASGQEAAAALLRSAWPAMPARQDDLAALDRFCACTFLQPFAEFLADHAQVPAPEMRIATCPFCASKPLVGVLRPEGEGGKRSLICSFCRTEWDYLRIACPTCGERREEKLCVYTTPKFEGIRVEACETCKAFLKTVDLTRNGMVVPEVDDLAAIPLTLWADENGFRQATRNIFVPLS